MKLLCVLGFILILVKGRIVTHYYQSITRPNDVTLYMVGLPDDYEPLGPLLPVFLHLVGGGAIGSDPNHLTGGGPLRVMQDRGGVLDPSIGMDNMIYVVPNMPLVCLRNTDIFLAREALEHAAAYYRIDWTRVYVSGISRGGTGVYQFTGAFPDLPAAALVFSGGGFKGLVGPDESEGCFPRTVPGPLISPCSLYANDVPLWIFHGTLDYPGFEITPYAATRVYNYVMGCWPRRFTPRFTLISGAQHTAADIYTPAFFNTANGTWSLEPPGLDQLHVQPSIYSWVKQFRRHDRVRPLPVPGTDRRNLARDGCITSSSFAVAVSNTSRQFPGLAVDGNDTSFWANDPSQPGPHSLLVDLMDSELLIDQIVIIGAAVVGDGGNNRSAATLSELGQLTVALAPALASTPTAVDMATTTNQPGNFSISIRVRDSNGNPVLGALGQPLSNFTRLVRVEFQDPNVHVREIQIWGRRAIARTRPPTPSPTAMQTPPSNYTSLYLPIAIEPESWPRVGEGGQLPCFCDGFEGTAPFLSSNVTSSCLGPNDGWSAPIWSSPWEMVTVSGGGTAVPAFKTVNTVPWEHLRGLRFLSFQPAWNDWDCFVTRRFPVFAGIAVRMRMLLVPSPALEKTGPSQDYFRVESRPLAANFLPLDSSSSLSEFTLRVLISLDYLDGPEPRVYTVDLGVPPANASYLELRFSVDVTMFEDEFFNLDSLIIEFDNVSHCPGTIPQDSLETPVATAASSVFAIGNDSSSSVQFSSASSRNIDFDSSNDGTTSFHSSIFSQWSHRSPSFFPTSSSSSSSSVSAPGLDLMVGYSANQLPLIIGVAVMTVTFLLFFFAVVFFLWKRSRGRSLGGAELKTISRRTSRSSSSLPRPASRRSPRSSSLVIARRQSQEILI